MERILPFSFRGIKWVPRLKFGWITFNTTSIRRGKWVKNNIATAAAAAGRGGGGGEPLSGSLKEKIHSTRGWKGTKRRRSPQHQPISGIHGSTSLLRAVSDTEWREEYFVAAKKKINFRIDNGMITMITRAVVREVGSAAVLA